MRISVRKSCNCTQPSRRFIDAGRAKLLIHFAALFINHFTVTPWAGHGSLFMFMTLDWLLMHA